MLLVQPKIYSNWNRFLETVATFQSIDIDFIVEANANEYLIEAISIELHEIKFLCNPA